MILAIYDSIGFLQTKGAPLLGEAPLIGRLRYNIITVKLANTADWKSVHFSLEWEYTSGL